MSQRPSSTDQEQTVRTLLEVMQKLAHESRPHKVHKHTLNLDSSLDTDMGLDSLARVELISRLEKRFNVVLPQRVFADAESPRDLLRAITGVQGRKETNPPYHVSELQDEAVEDLPHSASTLIEVLKWHVERQPDRLHIRVLSDEGKAETLTYSDLWQGACGIAAGLQQRGISPSDTVAIMLPSGRDYFFSFFGVLLSGAVPVPIYPPARRSQLEEHLRRHSGILNNCLVTTLITVPEAKLVGQLLKSQVQSLRDVVTARDLSTKVDTHRFPQVRPDDVAFLQYTSGSTGSPKGVVLSHANLLANIRVMGEAIKASHKDVFVSWLPLYHDMGLIGAWLGSMYFAVQFVVMSPLTFLVRPHQWLWAIHQFRGTLSASPNFGYELCLKRITDEDLKGMDLSSWRLAFNGAEPVSPMTIANFTEKFGNVGFRAETMMPVYGLAESSVGLAFPPVDEKPVIDCVQRETFTRTGYAKPDEDPTEKALCFVGCGGPLPGHQIRIVDSDGRELPERQEGYLQFCGPSATSGYYRNPEATKGLFRDEWLDSGDLAYIAAGSVFITGRQKDLIIRGGRNFYPHEIEEAVGGISGIRKGCVVAFGTTESRSGTERLVFVAETRESDPIIKEKLKKQIVVLANDLIGIPPDEVMLVPPHTVLKTSSGKIRRSACRELYEQGRLAPSRKTMWLLLIRSASKSLIPILHRLRQKAANLIYAGYAWTLFSLLGFMAWLFVMILPVLKWRWAMVRGLSRLFALSSGTTLNVSGLEKLPPLGQPCIFVSNHASYLDSYTLIAAIPRAFSFVAKAELREKKLIWIFLKRLGVEFVERFDKEKGVIDARRMTDMAKRRQNLFFFPEGTFTRMPGLLNFYMGAFVTAADADIPLIPVVIRGTRSILRSDSWFPRRGRISVSIGDPITTDQLTVEEKANRWRTALTYRDRARKYILDSCGEPDLSHEVL